MHLLGRAMDDASIVRRRIETTTTTLFAALSHLLEAGEEQLEQQEQPAPTSPADVADAWDKVDVRLSILLGEHEE